MSTYRISIKIAEELNLDFTDGGTDADIIGIMCQQMEDNGRDIVEWLAEHATVTKEAKHG